MKKPLFLRPSVRAAAFAAIFSFSTIMPMHELNARPERKPAHVITNSSISQQSQKPKEVLTKADMPVRGPASLELLHKQIREEYDEEFGEGEFGRDRREFNTADGRKRFYDREKVLEKKQAEMAKAESETRYKEYIGRESQKKALAESREKEARTQNKETLIDPIAAGIEKHPVAALIIGLLIYFVVFHRREDLRPGGDGY